MHPRILFVSLALALGLAACKKDAPQTAPACGEGSQGATVLHGRNLCDPDGWVLQLDGAGTYPPDALPVAFQQAGLRVCVAYSLYEDPRTCAFCGGTRLRIQQIEPQ